MTASLEWSSELAFGIPVIDEQHHTFVDMVNELSGLIDADASRQAFENLILRLIDYGNRHFETEEKYFRDFNYEFAVEHTSEHDKMRDRLRIFRRDFDKSGKEVSGELFYFTIDWLVDHLEKQDKKYVACFKEHGLGA